MPSMIEVTEMMNARITMISLLLMFLGGASLALGQQPDAPVAEPLNLEQAIKLALAHNRSVQNARLEVENSADELAAARTRRLPSFKLTTLVAQPLTGFDLTFEKGVFGTFPETGPIPDKDTTISSSMKPTALVNGQITQPLTQLRRIKFQIKQLELGREISKEELRLKQQSVVNEVKRAYYAAQQTQSAFESAQAAIKLYRELDRVTGDYVVQQVALKNDQLDVQAKLAKAEYELLTLRNLLAAQKEQLNLLLGRDVRMEFAVGDGLETAQYALRETDLAAARARALAQRPEIKEARLKVGQAKYDRASKKTEFMPDVSLSVNYLSPFGYSSVLPKNIASVGVQVEWEVFDWGRKKRELAAKERALRQADNAVSDVENQVLMEVGSQFRKLQEHCQLLRVARMTQKAEEANVQVVVYKYRARAVLLKDVLQAQAALADANYDYQKALLSFWTTKADFEKAMGEDR
jgi:outer membrane protein TolC